MPESNKPATSGFKIPDSMKKKDDSKDPLETEKEKIEERDDAIRERNEDSSKNTEESSLEEIIGYIDVAINAVQSLAPKYKQEQFITSAGQRLGDARTDLYKFMDIEESLKGNRETDLSRAERLEAGEDMVVDKKRVSPEGFVYVNQEDPRIRNVEKKGVIVGGELVDLPKEEKKEKKENA